MKIKKKKPGRVIRVDPMVVRYMEEQRTPGETTAALMRRLLGLPARERVRAANG